MGLYVGENVWAENVYQFEETDVVQGGPNGIDNKPIKELADRTQYLKDQNGIIQNLLGYQEIIDNGVITADNIGNLFGLISTGISNFTIDAASNFKHGTIIPLLSWCNENSVCNIRTSGQPIVDLMNTPSSVHMHHNEQIILISLTDHFKILSSTGNFFCAGEEVKSRKRLNNTLKLQGQLLKRNEFPRLWKFIESLTFGQEVTNEATYFYDSLTYRGYFTTGDGITTFRLPDERGMFERAADAGRGIDIGRKQQYAGSFELDDIVSHSHSYNDDTGYSYTNSPNSPRRGNGYSTPTTYSKYTNSFGGNETRPKNISKFNLIKY